MPSLYRGFKQPLTSAVQVNIFHQSPRTPTHTSLEVHEYADEWFFHKFGIKARSTTIICSTDFSQSRSYGASYRITADNPFAIIYSPLVRDFLEHQAELSSPSPSQEEVWAWLEEKKYTMVMAAENIESDFLGEVMLCCKSFSVIPHG